MSHEKNVRAPYNFVPFHTKGSSGAAGAKRVGKVLARYQDVSDLPHHDIIDPALKAGEIHVTLQAETPVFVSDGHKKKVGDKTVDDGHFFRGANGQFMLPGSTIRGMVRENMQILGFGSILPGEDLEDHQLFFRDVASSKKSIAGPLKTYYKDVMDTKSYPPRNVQAGYLRKKGDAYYIQPVKGSYIRVPRGDPALMKASLTDGEAMTVKVAYTVADGRVKSIRGGDRPVPGKEQGVLLYTGKSVNKRNARYLFPAADEGAVPVLISEEDRISYQEDFETRKNVLGEKYRFWELPKDEDGEGKPVFYVRHDGHTYFGMSLFLRIGYSHKFSDGLPAPDPKVKRQEGSVPLDYPHAVLGFAGEKHSYRSRVSFGDFPAQGNPEECPAIRTILGQPKPSWYAGYVADGKHYNDNDFRLRGYKLYWLKEAGATPVPEGKESVGSTLRPLPEGTVFRGVIRYKNLHPDELGLLLWALRLEDGCFQSIGMGKPYGFGRMKLTLDKLLEYDVSAMYSPDNLCSIQVSGDQNSIEQYIRMYNEYACGRLHIKTSNKKEPRVSSVDAIKDFFYMRKTIRDRDEVSYMELPEFKNMAGTLSTVQQIREDAQAEEQKGNAAYSMEDLWEHWDSKRL